MALRSPLFRRLTTLVVLTAAAGDGMGGITMQYLQLRVGFGPKEQACPRLLAHPCSAALTRACLQAAYLMVYGVCGIAVQAFALRPLLAAVGERGALVVGCGCFAAKLLLMSMPLLTLPVAFAAAAVGTGAELIFPAISALKANNAAAHEQGLVQGGLFAARSLAAGLAPLPWAALFRACTRADRGPRAPPPQTPFLLAAALVLLAMVVAAALPCGGAPAPPLAVVEEDEGAPSEDAQQRQAAEERRARGDDLRAPLLGEEPEALL